MESTAVLCLTALWRHKVPAITANPISPLNALLLRSALQDFRLPCYYNVVSELTLPQLRA